jgi:hypothetical protein
VVGLCVQFQEVIASGYNRLSRIFGFVELAPVAKLLYVLTQLINFTILKIGGNSRLRLPGVSPRVIPFELQPGGKRVIDQIHATALYAS